MNDINSERKTTSKALYRIAGAERPYRVINLRYRVKSFYLIHFLFCSGTREIIPRNFGSKQGFTKIK